MEGGDSAGHPGLRRAIAEHVVAARGARCSPEQVFVTGGTQQAYEEVLRLVVELVPFVVIAMLCRIGDLGQ
jgi:GntR family transcriptional regulator/MocR family aminotransferase